MFATNTSAEVDRNRNGHDFHGMARWIGMPLSTALVREGATTEAVNASCLVSDAVRGRRGSQARFVAGDADSRWLMNLGLTPPWAEGPPALQRYAKFVAAATRLGRSAHTVRTQLRTAYAKLGARGRIDAVNRARSLGLLD